MKEEKNTKRTKSANAVATQSAALPTTALADRIAQDAGAGMEGVDRDSFAIPFVRGIAANVATVHCW